MLEIVNDDMPFLVNSVLAELADRGIDVRFVVHPVLTVVRDDAGRLIALKDAKTAPGALRESVIYIHLEPIDDEARRADIVAAIERVLADIRLCVADWRAMLKRVEDVIAELETHRPPVPADEIAEAVAFLEWLVDNNFTFLGVRNYQLSAGEEALEPMFETGLGILRSRDVGVVQRWNQPLVITPEIRALLKEPTLLIVTKSAARSRVHRHVYMDYVGVKRFDRWRQAHRRVPHRRPLHLHGLYALDTDHPLSAPQGRRGARACRLRSRRALRKGTGECAGELSARRAFPAR